MHSAIWAPATCVLSRSLTSKKPIGCPGGVSARHAERHFAAEPTREGTRQELMAKRSSILERQEFLEKEHRFLTWVLSHRFFDSRTVDELEAFTRENRLPGSQGCKKQRVPLFANLAHASEELFPIRPASSRSPGVGVDRLDSKTTPHQSALATRRLGKRTRGSC